MDGFPNTSVAVNLIETPLPAITELGRPLSMIVELNIRRVAEMEAIDAGYRVNTVVIGVSVVMEEGGDTVTVKVADTLEYRMSEGCQALPLDQDRYPKTLLNFGENWT